MALKKKADPLDEIKREAEENGVLIAKTASGTYAASLNGEIELEDYEDPRQLLDDQLAKIEMDGKDGLYAYEDAEIGYAVSVTGGETFEHETLAGAFALAKESLVAKEEKPKRTRKAPIAAGEVLDPVVPNGADRRLDAADTLAEAALDIARILTDLAGRLRTGATPVPFVADFAEKFDEDSVPSPAPARSRITRERGAKKGA